MQTGPATVDQALVTVYRRPDAYYIVTSVQTTAGVWLHAGPAVVVTPDIDAAALGDAVAAAIRPDAVLVPHPQQDQWSKQRKQSLGPLMRQARVRGWKAFVLPAAVVSIHRNGCRCTVTPERRDERRVDVFFEDLAHRIEPAECTAAHLGAALMAAFTFASAEHRDH